jgi:Phage capsid family
MPSVLAPRPAEAQHRELPAAGVVRYKLQAVELSTPASDGSHRFVISTESVDLEGDVVVQSGLELVSERLPAQIDHSGKMRDLIGWWDNVKTRAQRTTADLHLLPAGMNQAADLVRSLLDAGVRLAASIGFVPVKTEFRRSPDDDSGAITGFNFLRSKLAEVSIVVVPANPDALSFAKSLIHSAVEASAFESMLAAAERFAPSSAPQAAAAAARAHRSRGQTMPTIAERITAAEAALVTQRDALADAQATMLDNMDDQAAQDSTRELLAHVQRATDALQLLRDAETALAADARPAGSASAAAPPSGPGARAAPTGAPALLTRQAPRRVKPSADLLVRGALLAFESHCRREPLEVTLERRYGHDEATMAVASLVTRAAQAPAMTNVAGWAQELTRETYAAFMDLLQPMSVIPRLNFQRFSFENSAVIKVPKRNEVTTPNLAAAFRAEGAPIRVGAVQTGMILLTPKSMGVIGTWTMELFERSTPNVEDLIRQWMLEDTAKTLDAYFLSNTAAVAGVSPGGIQSVIRANDTRPSTGATVAQITTDLQTMIAMLAAHNLLIDPQWVMNPVNASALTFALTATGARAFPDAQVKGGSVGGFPIVASTTVPTNEIFLIDGPGVDFAGDAPKFVASDVATLHEEDTTPLPLASTGTPNTVAAPMRSLFQTNSAALRAVWGLDWNLMRTAAVQVLTGVAWAPAVTP